MFCSVLFRSVIWVVCISPRPAQTEVRVQLYTVGPPPAQRPACGRGPVCACLTGRGTQGPQPWRHAGPRPEHHPGTTADAARWIDATCNNETDILIKTFLQAVRSPERKVPMKRYSCDRPLSAIHMCRPKLWPDFVCHPLCVYHQQFY